MELSDKAGSELTAPYENANRALYIEAVFVSAVGSEKVPLVGCSLRSGPSKTEYLVEISCGFCSFTNHEANLH